MLIPIKENIQKIFEIHQNQCAFSKCNEKIIDSDGHFLGNIFFIESNIKGHSRFNSALTNEQMIDYHNLILLCDNHGLDIEWKEKKYTIFKLREEIFKDLETLTLHDYDFPNEKFEEILSHFIGKHDPDRLSHVQIKSIEYGTGTPHGGGRVAFVNMSRIETYIRPTRHFTKGKFEIINTKRKIREFDKVVFYPKNSTYSKGIQADIEIKSQMRIEGKVPDLPKGDYLISLRSVIDET